MSTDRTQEAIAQASAAGWQIVSRAAQGTQFRHPKQWSKGAVVLGLVLLLLWGFGLLILVLAALDYALAKDKLAYVTAEALARGESPKIPAAGTSGLAMGLAIGLAVIVLLAVCGVMLGG